MPELLGKGQAADAPSSSSAPMHSLCRPVVRDRAMRVTKLVHCMNASEESAEAVNASADAAGEGAAAAATGKPSAAAVPAAAAAADGKHVC